MKMLKKFIVGVTTGTLILGLTACGGTETLPEQKTVQIVQDRIIREASSKLQDYFQINMDDYEEYTKELAESVSSYNPEVLLYSKDTLTKIMSEAEMLNSYYPNYINKKLDEVVEQNYEPTEDEIMSTLNEVKQTMIDEGVTDLDQQKVLVKDMLVRSQTPEIGTKIYEAALNEATLEYLEKQGIDISQYDILTIQDVQETVLPNYNRENEGQEGSTDKRNVNQENSSDNGNNPEQVEESNNKAEDNQ